MNCFTKYTCKFNSQNILISSLVLQNIIYYLKFSKDGFKQGSNNLPNGSLRNVRDNYKFVDFLNKLSMHSMRLYSS